jgi:hypothetical protein
MCAEAKGNCKLTREGSPKAKVASLCIGARSPIQREATFAFGAKTRIYFTVFFLENTHNPIFPYFCIQNTGLEIIKRNGIRENVNLKSASDKAKGE